MRQLLCVATNMGINAIIYAISPYSLNHLVMFKNRVMRQGFSSMLIILEVQTFLSVLQYLLPLHMQCVASLPCYLVIR